MILRRFMKHVTDQNWFAVGLDVKWRPKMSMRLQMVSLLWGKTSLLRRYDGYYR